jgi:nucleoside-diphosphate-sugar epimerase
MSAVIIQSNNDQPLIVVIGNGLIGSEVVNKAKLYLATHNILHVGFHWEEPLAGAESIRKAITDKTTEQSRIEIFWCAGKAGFSASHKEMEREFITYEKIIHYLCQQYSRKMVVNLVSSAGGIYEGVDGTVCKGTMPHPMRAYGESKLKQELLLKKMGIQYRIFRPTTIYGIAGMNARKGLLSTLIYNTLKGQTTAIYARADTLRDFLYVGDVAKRMVEVALKRKYARTTEILAAGRPVSVHYIIHKIHLIIGKRPFVHYVASADNEKNIIFSPDSFPQDWSPTSFEEGVTLVARLQAFVVGGQK